MKYKPNFIYPEIKETDRTFGATISGPILRPDGDWRQFLPLDENQGQNNVEPSSCYIEAQQASIATVQEEQYGIKDRNYSARFNALLSNGTENGGDPLNGAYSIKKDGLIPQDMMDWNGVYSWQDFHSWKGVDKNKCIEAGKLEVAQWDISYKIIAEIDDALQLKYLRLKDALKRAPVSLSVYAWAERNGKYYKPEGARDTHLVEAVYVDADNCIHIRDTYDPHLKVLEAWTDFEFAMYHIVRKRSPEEQLKNAQLGFLSIILAYVSNLLKSIGEVVGSVFQKEN